MRLVVTDAEVTLADVLSLRVSLDDPVAEGAELVLRHRTEAVERRVRLGAPGAELRDVGFAVSLAPLALTPGRWDAYLGLGDRLVRMKSVDPGFSLDHLEAYTLSRRALAYRAYRTQGGYLAIKITEVEPTAEVRAVWFREGRFEVTGQLAYTGIDDDDMRHTARLTLTRDRPLGTLATTATVQGVRFHAQVSLCDMVDAHSGTWHPTLAVEGLSDPLRFSARLDDVDGKGRRLQYPAAHVDGVAIQPVYTDDDELRLEVNR
ncbi:hypothetical protein SAMN05421505_1595 [Sinosporangium album]|uniref:Uncharacterized protein n=1 Tax=Sinosporangium album TaxID=504805 RepID=A0A1G8L066_9ACTN|nr:hypothetical protein [Sinosporangium album]SDI49088.1 hypothetical protein SAMN05421505_1595 [Sinosporangium album]